MTAAEDGSATRLDRLSAVEGRLVSVNVGLPRDVTWRGRRVHTAIWKHAVAGRRHVGRENVAGDGQADRAGHGGEHRAVFVYQLDSYRHWEAELGRDDFAFGQFGENFTIEGLSDAAVRIGDRFAIGTALFEVTQPRVTCFKVGMRLDEPAMPALLVSHGRPGFYLRVLREGDVGAGDPIRRVADGPADISVREASALLYLPGHAPERLELAMSVPALSDGWRGSFAALLEQRRADGGDGNAGLGAPTPPPAWSGFRPFAVSALRQETATVRSLTLEPDGGDPVTWRAGQFVPVRVRPRGARASVVRSYSISSAPGSGPLRISVKREPGGRAGEHLHIAVRVGDRLDLAAPRGAFTLDPGAAAGPVVLLSAGIGVTPVLAMLGALARAGSRRPVWWIHGSRTAE
jgi:MOSC domain-containing protein YiiM